MSYNTFGSATKQFLLCDPRSVRAARPRFRRDALPALDRANSITVPTGRNPSRGWVLLPRYEYVQLDRYSTSLQLSVGDTRQSDNVGTLKNLAIVQAQCVTTGLSTDDNSLYLIELTDARGILHNQWFQAPLAAQYNIRAPAYPQVFHPSSMDGGTTWTWATMLQDIWNRESARLGSWPGFPSGYTVLGTPEGHWFAGVPLWGALCDLLEHVGLTVACDLTSTTPFTLVVPGAADSAFTALQTKYATNLEDDQEWIDIGAGRVPKTVTVLFRRRNSTYGTEETATYRNDSMARQWNMVAYYSVTKSAPSTFSSAVGEHFIWSDFTIRHDVNSDPLDEDLDQADAIADERVRQYFDVVYSRTSGSMSRVYAGALPFKTGSQVDRVTWSQDYSGQSRQGWRTHITRWMHRSP